MKRKSLGGLTRGSRGKKKRKVNGSFFKEIIGFFLTCHTTIKNKKYNKWKTCIKNLKECIIPKCPTIPDQFISVPQYYKLHMAFTLHEACYLVKKKLEERGIHIHSLMDF